MSDLSDHNLKLQFMGLVPLDRLPASPAATWDAWVARRIRLRFDLEPVERWQWAMAALGLTAERRGEICRSCTKPPEEPPARPSGQPQQPQQPQQPLTPPVVAVRATPTVISLQMLDSQRQIGRLACVSDA